MSAHRVSAVRLVAVVPAWMLADGEYGDLAVGGTAEFGFALEPELIEAGSGATDVDQIGGGVPVTRVSGTAVVLSPEAPPVIDAGLVKPIVITDAQNGDALSVRGRLVVEPALWATDGVLWPMVPDGVRLWALDRVRVLRQAVESDLAVVPSAADVAHDAIYLLDLSRP